MSLSLLILLTASIFPKLTTSAIDSFVYNGCSQLKFTPDSPYESNVNSLLTSLVNSASVTSYNNFTIPGSSPQDVVYGLFQCEGDLSVTDCARCVNRAVSQLGTICPDSTGAALQLQGCFIKYDNTAFLAVEDKTVVYKRCGPSIAYNSDALTRIDGVMSYIASGGAWYRVGASGDAQGMAQCVQDLSVSECQDCVSEAIGELRSNCGSSAWGDMFLGKCYARYSYAGSHSTGSSSNDNEMEKTLAIFIGLVAVVAVLVVFMAFLNKALGGKDGK
ncbi:Gnk2-homologous domain [Dillenia turbinata]|uniref:Gnk2-homologous domain n=1 Tax=Dillenia turbinata TaxID=194707 RepID=A0AAN8V2Q3_9MAGN